MTSLLTAAFLLAHGALESPMSRVYGCYRNNMSDPACQAAVAAGGPQAVYDWNGVRQGDAAGRHRDLVPDGRLCSGGTELHKGFDLARTDWAATPLTPDAAGNTEFVFRATAPHATAYFRFFITRDTYNPAQPLAWRDLEATPFCDPAWTFENGRYRMTCQLPKRTGRHLIYTIWQRSDSGEAFYSCSDVTLGAPPAPGPAWQELRRITAQESLPSGTVITVRTLSAQGTDLGAVALTLARPLGAAEWAQALALEVNAKSTLLRAGVLQADGSILPVLSASANGLYAQVPGYRAEIDIRKPAAPPATPPNTEPALTYPANIGSYAAGTLLRGPDGQLYRCLARAVALCNSATPSAVLSYAPGWGSRWRDAWELAVNAPPPPVTGNIPTYPNGRSTYTAGTIVRGTDGKLYQCRPFPFAGWCASSSALHYAPGTGLAWTDAWILLP